jgi:hypothetical protein
VAWVASDWSMPFACTTVVESPLAEYTFTPPATRASEELTMLTPLAPLRALPLRLTVLLPTVVTEEPSAAIEELSSPAAVTLSIWLSRSCFFVCLSGEGLVVFWPKTTEPLTRTEAVTRVHTNLFILPPWAWLTKLDRLRRWEGLPSGHSDVPPLNPVQGRQSKAQRVCD